MWSYSFEVPILMILGIMLLFYYSRPRLPIRKNWVFLMMALTEMATICIDVSASVACNNYKAVPNVILGILNMLYFVAFFTRAYTMYLFAVSVMKDTLEKNTVIRQLVRTPLYIGVLLSLLSFVFGSADRPYFIFFIDDGGYHSGMMYNYVYVCGFYYVSMALISLALFGKNLGRRREKYGVLLYNLILIVSLFIRMTLPKLLIMDTFVLMAILIVFLAFGNPEFYLDLRGTAFNRYAFSEHLEEAMGCFKYHPLGVAIHDFHEMRDIYGSAQMEEGLSIISKCFKQMFPGGMVFYVRNGRFIILAQPDTDLNEKCEVIAERFEHSWKSQDVELYLSAGFAIYDVVYDVDSSETVLTTMLRVLDKAAKIEDRKPIHANKEDIIRVQKEKKIRQYIEKAVEEGGFDLFLQPIMDAKSEKAIGAEALARLRDENGEIILPGDFIPVAENSGRINELGEIIFEKTCRFIKEEGLKNLSIDWINVNLSPAQFVRTDLAERYAAIAEKYKVDPSCVHLEITEGAMIDDAFFNRQISAMTRKGFKFVLDDYGTGYSNLARLKKCPFINVKLDMTIVWAHCKEPDEILPTMVQTFKHMGFSITAEGVENLEMVETMREMGCDFLQGFYYSRALPAAEFAEKYAFKG